MTSQTLASPPLIPASAASYLVSTAARAPSVHNTQPWRFRVTDRTVELYADPARKLRIDPLGRELLISCGAAVFGLKLAIRSLGYQPVIRLLPDPRRLRLLARAWLGEPEPMSPAEQRMLAALPHRHTHRGPFAADPLPAGLLAGLPGDAMTEGAALALLDRAGACEQLAAIVTAAGGRADQDPRARADVMGWTRGPGSAARDGIPATAFASGPGPYPGRLPQRDFDLGRRLGQLDPSGPPPAATAILLTPGDGRGDWLRAGMALHRVLAHAATWWVFASLHTQVLTAAATRELVRDRLELPGCPQLIMQLGTARSTRVTARRPAADVLEP